MGFIMIFRNNFFKIYPQFTVVLSDYVPGAESTYLTSAKFEESDLNVRVDHVAFKLAEAYFSDF